MSYTIIGGDGKEYGPISGDDIRKWIAENRLNSQSMAKAESDAAFRPLSTFPEFADVFAPQAPHIPGTIAPPVSASSGDWATRDYDLDIGDCISRGWNLFKSDMGNLWICFWLAILMVGIAGMVFGGMTGLIIPKSVMQVAGFRVVYNVMLQGVLALVNGPLLGAVFYIFLQRLRGGRLAWLMFSSDFSVDFRSFIWETSSWHFWSVYVWLPLVSILRSKPCHSSINFKTSHRDKHRI